ncbi:hypothetical protein [Amycolatopsis sp. NPDC051371]|uniref:hypothetical protein n=1 Tax=Amycolatopsis sp. NPDC051371 TaxID=3155800 RepID=UPI0034206FF4
MAVIVRGAKQGKWDSRHVTNRAGRLIPFAACIGSLAVGFVVLLVGNAPHEMIALAAAEHACLVAALAVSFGLRFKISVHAIVVRRCDRRADEGPRLGLAFYTYCSVDLLGVPIACTGTDAAHASRVY